MGEGRKQFWLVICVTGFTMSSEKVLTAREWKRTLKKEGRKEGRKGNKEENVAEES